MSTIIWVQIKKSCNFISENSAFLHSALPSGPWMLFHAFRSIAILPASVTGMTSNRGRKDGHGPRSMAQHHEPDGKAEWRKCTCAEALGQGRSSSARLTFCRVCGSLLLINAQGHYKNGIKILVGRVVIVLLIKTCKISFWIIT